jgi:ribosome-binding factor A
MGASARMRRVNEALREVIGDAIASESEREASLAGLRSSHGVLQSAIARQMRIKRTPTLSFHYDEAPERGVRISRLLDR